MSSDKDDFDLDACIERIRASDQAAARQLVERLYPLLARIARNRLPRRMALEDMMQEIFLKLFTRIDQYKGNVPFTHWAARIAVTTCIDHLRAQKRRPELRWADLPEQEAELLDAVLTNTNDISANDSLASRELVHILLSQLSPQDQFILQLLDLEQKSLAEIRSLTGWNTTLIKVRAFRARKKLQKLFQQLKNQERS